MSDDKRSKQADRNVRATIRGNQLRQRGLGADGSEGLPLSAVMPIHCGPKPAMPAEILEEGREIAKTLTRPSTSARECAEDVALKCAEKIRRVDWHSDNSGSPLVAIAVIILKDFKPYLQPDPAAMGLMERMAACIKEMDEDKDTHTSNYYHNHKLYDVMPASSTGFARILGLHIDILKLAEAHERKGKNNDTTE